MNEPNYHPFAERFAQVVKDSGLYQIDFGATIDRDRKCIIRWSKGRGFPTVWTLTRICKTYGVSADWLLGLDGES